MSCWPLARLDSVAKVIRGVTYAKGEVVQSPDPMDVPVLRAGNINERLLIDRDLVWLPRRAVSNDQLLERDDIVMCMSSGSAAIVGKSAQLKTEWFGSFGAFCAVIRTDQSRADPSFLAHVFSTRAFRVFAGAAQGNNIKNLNKSALEGFAIPLPPLEEQRRIVGLLDRAAEIRRRADAARAKARAIIPALFLDTFGDPATNSKEWQTVNLDELCDLVRGSSPRPQGDPRFFGGPVPRLMISDITRDGTYVTPRTDSLTVEGAARSRPMKSGDVIMAVSGAVGLPAILAIDACIHDGFVGFRSLHSRVTPQFFYYYLLTVRKSSQSQAVGATFQNLNTDQIRRWVVPVPPEKYQVEFTTAAHRIESLARHLDAAAAKAEAMAAGLSAEVFGSPAAPARRNAA